MNLIGEPQLESIDYGHSDSYRAFVEERLLQKGKVAYEVKTTFLDLEGNGQLSRFLAEHLEEDFPEALERCREWQGRVQGLLAAVKGLQQGELSWASPPRRA